MLNIPNLSIKNHSNISFAFDKVFEDFPDETHQYLNAPERTCVGSVKEAIVTHLVKGTTPDAETLKHIQGIPNISASKSKTGNNTSSCEDNWELFLVDVVLFVFSVAGLKSKLNSESRAALAAQFGETDLLGLEAAWFRVIDKNASSFAKAKAVFGFVGGCTNLISLKDILHSIEEDLTTWEAIEDLITVIFQLIAWFGSDWVAAVGEILLTVESLYNSLSSLDKAESCCSLDQFFTDITTTETQEGLIIPSKQPYTPAPVTFDDNVLLFYRDPKSSCLVYKYSTTQAITALISQKQKVDSSEGQGTFETLNSWSSKQIVPNTSTMVGSPAVAVLSDMLFIFYQKKAENPKKPDYKVYYVTTKDLKTWSGEQNIGETVLTTTIPGPLVYGGQIHLYFPDANESLIWDSVFNGTTWNKPYLLNANVSTSTSPQGSYSLGEPSVSYRGAGADDYLYFTVLSKQTGEWTDPTRIQTKCTTSATPVCTNEADPIYFFRGTGSGKEIWRSMIRESGPWDSHHSCMGSPAILDDKYVFYCVSPGVFNFFAIN